MRRRPGRRPPTTGELAGSYSPKRIRDLLFLHGLAISAARRALREGEPMYPPAEWVLPPAPEQQEGGVEPAP